jgi:uncharacterized glyoxalase superfamily protein PhnB
MIVAANGHFRIGRAKGQALESEAMIRNRSVPVDTILPHVAYQNVGSAIVWLARVFGFRENYRYGDLAQEGGAQMLAGGAYLMLMHAKGNPSPAQLGFGTQSLTIFIADVEAHFAHAKAEGATIFEDPHETGYGEFQYGALDCDGHRWLFSRHARDLAPEDWGARSSKPL